MTTTGNLAVPSATGSTSGATVTTLASGSSVSSASSLIPHVGTRYVVCE